MAEEFLSLQTAEKLKINPDAVVNRTEQQSLNYRNQSVQLIGIDRFQSRHSESLVREITGLIACEFSFEAI